MSQAIAPAAPTGLRVRTVEIEDPGECADELVQLALKGGGPDNITCIIADVVDLDRLPRGEDSPSTSPQIVGSAARNRHRPTLASGPAAKAAAVVAARRERQRAQTPPARRRDGGRVAYASKEG